MKPIELTGNSLTLEELGRFLDTNCPVMVSATAMEAVGRSAAFVGKLALGGKGYYGINTGFGKFARTRVEPDQASRLQENLLRSHATGAGPELPSDIVRLMLLLRVNSLVSGYSGVSPTLVELLLAMLANDIVPAVPTYGSVGASGDLAPLAHMALPVIGEGDVYLRGERMTAAAAFAATGVAAVHLGPKEGLALINGTQMMSAFAANELLRMRRCLKTSMCAAAMSLEAYETTDRIFDSRVHELKNHPEEKTIAAGFRRLTEGSEIVQSHRDCDRVQDPYSFRCIPQVLGAVAGMMEWTSQWVEREINAVTDNPLVFHDDGDVLSGGNFHGEHMAFVLDSLAIAASEIASISERRIDKLIDSDTEKLPRCLVQDPGLNSGLMITQYLAAALVSENKIHAHPASVDSIPTSMGFEDHVSMGSIGAIKLARVVDNVERVTAVELLCGGQALDFHKPLRPGKGTARSHELVRESIPFIDKDVILGPHIETLVSMVRSGEIVRGVEGVVGDLLAPEHAR